MIIVSISGYDMITVLAGGTGSVKLVRGLVAQHDKVNVITNVGDNYWLYGLYVCPDIDTIIISYPLEHILYMRYSILLFRSSTYAQILIQ